MSEIILTISELPSILFQIYFLLFFSTISQRWGEKLLCFFRRVARRGREKVNVKRWKLMRANLIISRGNYGIFPCSWLRYFCPPDWALHVRARARERVSRVHIAEKRETWENESTVAGVARSQIDSGRGSDFFVVNVAAAVVVVALLPVAVLNELARWCHIFGRVYACL